MPRRAAPTARSMSPGEPAGVLPITSSVAGETTSMVSDVAGATRYRPRCTAPCECPSCPPPKLGRPPGYRRPPWRPMRNGPGRARPAKRRRPTAAELETARRPAHPRCRRGRPRRCSSAGSTPACGRAPSDTTSCIPETGFGRCSTAPASPRSSSIRRRIAGCSNSGLGITNLVPRVTARASEHGADELRAGGRSRTRKVRRLAPRAVAFVGIGAYRTALSRPRARIGEQPEAMGRSRVWALPNPSGLQAHYQMDDLVAAYGALRRAVRPRTSSLPTGRRPA